ncbi:MAG: RecX family transcriptional regulator [Ignavibacteriales bacterium]|nr:RecX family transcriptional regulator [Ignavibacteriales bacterium]
MKNISKLEQQKRHPDRVNVYLDGEFAFGLNKEVVHKFSLRKGDQVTDELIDKLTGEEEYSTAKNKALKYISRRMRSEYEVKSKLREYEFPVEIIDKVIKYLSEINFLNDLEFAKAYIADLQRTKSAGKRLLFQQLKRKGIAKDTIEMVLNDIKCDKEESLAIETAKKYFKKFKTSRKPVDRKDQIRRISQALMRRGFDWSLTSKVLKQIFKNYSAQEDE